MANGAVCNNAGVCRPSLADSSRGECVCHSERGYAGEFCEFDQRPIDLSMVPTQCVSGMGSHGVVHNGTAYRTLDDAPPEGGSSGCQGPSNYLPLPPGYALVPPNADTIAVIAAHGWSTSCAVTADGAAWVSANSP